MQARRDGADGFAGFDGEAGRVGEDPGDVGVGEEPADLGVGQRPGPGAFGHAAVTGDRLDGDRDHHVGPDAVAGGGLARPQRRPQRLDECVRCRLFRGAVRTRWVRLAERMDRGVHYLGVQPGEVPGEDAHAIGRLGDRRAPVVVAACLGSHRGVMRVLGEDPTAGAPERHGVLTPGGA